MPWKVESMVSQKENFLLLHETGRFTHTYLCKEFGISRQTGYNILKRYSRAVPASNPLSSIVRQGSP